jgi:hypothetical protein
VPESVSLLMVEFLTWVAARSRTYAEAMEAWRSACPRHTVWEDALIGSLVQVGGTPRESRVTLTQSGKAILDGHAPRTAPQSDLPSGGESR